MNSSKTNIGLTEKLAVKNGLEVLGLGFLLLFSVIASVYQPGQKDLIWQAGQIELTYSHEHSTEPPDRNSGDWGTTQVSDISSSESVFWIRTEVNLPSGVDPIPPYALFLSGPFSAEAFWDSQSLGSKGQTGDTAETEQPGPIDAALYIPDSLSNAGEHRLELRVSNQNAGYNVETLIHTLAIGSYQSDARRQLRHYALPMILSGGFVLLLLLFARVFHSSGSTSAVVLAAMALFVLLQLGGEITRSMIDYPYNWHLWRSLVIWFFAACAGLSLNALVFSRIGRLKSFWLPLLVMTILITSYLAPGFDTKAVYTLYLCGLAPLFLSFERWRKNSLDLIFLAAGLLGFSWILSGNISHSLFLDSAFYITTMIFLTIVWFWTSRGSESIEIKVSQDSKGNHFFVRHTGRDETIPASKVLYLQATGNYAELICEDGKVVLHHLRLGQIMEAPPKDFFRVHRSYAVNLSKVTGLKSLEGSRYFAEIEGGKQVPVSRYQTKEIRTYLKNKSTV